MLERACTPHAKEVASEMLELDVETNVRSRRRPDHARGRTAALLAALLAVLVAGCGPLAADDAARYDYRQDATYAVPAGGVLYVREELSLAELDLTPSDVRAESLNWIPMGIRGESASAIGWIVIEPPEAPSGWRVRLWQARVVRERPLGDPEGVHDYRVEAELRVDVPEEAYDLTRRVTASVVARGGGEVALTFLVRAE